MWMKLPLLFLSVLDEIEIIAFVALVGLGRRLDAFVVIQDVLFPAALWIAAMAVLALIWWGRPPEQAQRAFGYVGPS